MRAVYFPAALLATRALYGPAPSARRAFALACALLNPALLIIDHGHFQYNCISLGLALLAAGLVARGAHVLGSLAFCAALNHKQMSLYFAPAFFAHLLGKCLANKGLLAKVRCCCCFIGSAPPPAHAHRSAFPSGAAVSLVEGSEAAHTWQRDGTSPCRGQTHRCRPRHASCNVAPERPRCVKQAAITAACTAACGGPQVGGVAKLGVAVVAAFAVAWSPWLTSEEAARRVVTRIFPLRRGLFEDYVANWWCTSSVLVKWKQVRGGL